MEKLKKDILLQHVTDSFARLENSMNGEGTSAWHAVRIKAIENLGTIGFPGKKCEEYKYTPITRRLEGSFPTLQFEIQPQTAKIEKGLFTPDGIEAHLLYFVNGVFDESLSTILEDDGLVITHLKNVKGDKDVNSILEKSVQNHDSFSLLNTVFSKEGVVINIDKNRSLLYPVYIIHITDSVKTTISQPRTIISIKESSKVTVAEVFYTVGSENIFTNSNTEIELDKNSKVHYYRVNLVANNTFMVNNTTVSQSGDSSFTSITIDLGGEIVRNNLNISQNGEGCKTNLYGLYAPSDTMHVDNHTVVDHQYPNTESNELYKGILTDKSTGVFNGKIYVRKEAQKTNAYQQNSNILLSDDATINTKPQLEIWADDVKCSHGCTTGQLDKEQIFYLRSRGISETDAKAMLLHAYALDILNHISIKPLRLLLDKKIMEVLKNS